MLKSNYIITGPDSPDGLYTFWSNELGWTEKVEQATTFDREILTTPLPKGGTGVFEIKSIKSPCVTTFFELKDYIKRN